MSVSVMTTSKCVNGTYVKMLTTFTGLVNNIFKMSRCGVWDMLEQALAAP